MLARSAIYEATFTSFKVGGHTHTKKGIYISDQDYRFYLSVRGSSTYIITLLKA